MKTVVAQEHDPRSRKRRVEVRENGKVLGGDVIDPGKTSEIQRRICKPYHVSMELVLAACNALGTEVSAEALADASPLILRLRGSKSSDAFTFPLTDDVTFGDIATATELLGDDGVGYTIPTDCLIEWDDARLSYLDVDVSAPIAEIDALRIARTIQPKPRWWHQSRSGGLHLYYEANGAFNAVDYVACAAVWMAQNYPEHRCEIKQVTRHPMQTGYPFHTQEPMYDVERLNAWMRATTGDADVDSIMESNGWTLGQRLPHAQCPIDPRPTSGNDSVVVQDKGLFCFVCNSQGLTLGSKTPGFIPYGYFANNGLRSTIQECVKCFTHWDHARIILDQSLDLPEPILRRCYRVLLSLWHGPDDPRIDRVFFTGQNLIRRRGYWQYLDGTTFKVSHGKRELAALPATRNEKDETVGPLVDRFCQGCDLSDFGYRAVDVVHGMKLWGYHLPYSDNRIVTVQRAQSGVRRPQYLPPDRRLSLDACRAVYESYFPNLPWDYLRLLIAARGVAEGGQGMPPFIYCWGASGAGKSQTVHLAASTIGDANTEVNWSHDNQRFRQGVQDAVQHGTFCTINEVKKSAQRVRMKIDLALEPLLTLTEHSTSHVLYTGPVALGRVPVVVMTETTAPVQLLRSEQLIRRLVNVQLPHRLAWESGVGSQACRFRDLSDDANRAADSLVSHIIDEFFSEPMTIFEIAEAIGFQRMETFAKTETNIEAILIAFFRAVCDPNLVDDPADNRRWGGKGWRKCDQSRGSEERNVLDNLYFTLADTADFTTSTRILETDWTRLLGHPINGPHIECQIRPISERHKSVVGVRFRQESKINGEITCNR